MTDRELLEASAKAAGIIAEWHTDDADFDATHEGMFLKGERGPDNSKYWNPLTDDGDALRLAVALRMDITHFSESVRADVDGHDDCNESSGTDPYAATRRAIVRAAAAMKDAT